MFQRRACFLWCCSNLRGSVTGRPQTPCEPGESRHLCPTHHSVILFSDYRILFPQFGSNLVRCSKGRSRSITSISLVMCWYGFISRPQKCYSSWRQRRRSLREFVLIPLWTPPPKGLEFALVLQKPQKQAPWSDCFCVCVFFIYFYPSVWWNCVLLVCQLVGRQRSRQNIQVKLVCTWSHR